MPSGQLSGAVPARRGDESPANAALPARRATPASAAIAAPPTIRAASRVHSSTVSISGSTCRRYRPPRRMIGPLVPSRRRSSAARVAERVARARDRQRERYLDARRAEPMYTNAAAGPTPHRAGGQSRQGQPATAARGGGAVLRSPARGYHRVLKVARTLADLAGAEKVGPAAHRRSAELPDELPARLNLRAARRAEIRASGKRSFKPWDLVWSHRAPGAGATARATSL